MNFRPTYLNILSALVIGIVIAIWAYSSTFVYDAPQLIESAKRQAAIIGFIFSFIVAYLVASLIQKKK